MGQILGLLIGLISKISDVISRSDWIVSIVDSGL